MKLFILISALLVTVNCYSYKCSSRTRYSYPTDKGLTDWYNFNLKQVSLSKFGALANGRSGTDSIRTIKLVGNSGNMFLSSIFYVKLIGNYKSDNYTADNEAFLSEFMAYMNTSPRLRENIYCVMKDINGCAKGLISYDFTINYGERETSDLSLGWYGDELDDLNPSRVTSPGPSETMSPGPSETMSPEPSETMSPEPSGTMSPEPSGTMSPEPSGTMSPEPSGTMSPEPSETTKFSKRAGVSCNKKTSHLFGYRSYNTMIVGDILRKGEYLMSVSGYRLMLQDNGKLCALGHDELEYWCYTNNPRAPTGPYYVKLESDGNLCFYDNSGKYDCVSKLSRPKGFYTLTIMNNGNIYIYNGKDVVARATKQHPYPFTNIIPTAYKAI